MGAISTSIRGPFSIQSYGCSEGSGSYGGGRTRPQAEWVGVSMRSVEGIFPSTVEGTENILIFKRLCSEIGSYKQTF